MAGDFRFHPTQREQPPRKRGCLNLMKTCQPNSEKLGFNRGVRVTLLVGAVLSSSAAIRAHAQTAYGVNAAGQLYNFDVNAPTAATLVGSIGFAPDGIDFNPANGQLYAFRLGVTTSSLYTLSLSSGTPTLVGSFATSGAGYDLTRASAFGFDVNPKTLQGDGSIRIRLIGNNGDNLRLNSATGGIAAVDPTLNFAAGSGTGLPAAVGAAYTNNVAATTGLTTLYDVTSLNDGLYTQNPPNNGTLNLVGPFSIDVQQLTGFDIFTAANGFNTAYLSTDATHLVPGAELYTVDLTSGSTVLVGGIGNGLGIIDIAVQPVPEPSTYAMILGATIFGAGWLRRGRRRGVGTV